ncbi:MAG: CBS domain-containing protein [Thermoproteus sp. AZ2]|jgi:CBS domain-containing protein|uniref:CBS domain-containing protein n=1 Tax=Thermoproteus sp. AZ2 TaxID=1609232 RepID=A0ACC6V0Y1_9CREN|nr:MAG: hypothetical protein TU35_04215 [Thermoproteus sp. AZ2]
MRVKDLIKKEVLTIESTATLMDAAEKMARLNVGLLVVVDKRGEPVGVISERDIVKAVADRLPLVAEVGELAAKNIITIDADADVHQAAKMMRENWVRHLAVVEGGRIIGVISVRDLLADEAIAAMAESLKPKEPPKG